MCVECNEVYVHVGGAMFSNVCFVMCELCVFMWRVLCFDVCCVICNEVGMHMLYAALHFVYFVTCKAVAFGVCCALNCVCFVMCKVCVLCIELCVFRDV